MITKRACNGYRRLHSPLLYGYLHGRARWGYLDLSGLPAVSRKKSFPESHIRLLGQDGWILAAFFFASLRTSTPPRSINTQKNLLFFCPNSLPPPPPPPLYTPSTQARPHTWSIAQVSSSAMGIIWSSRPVLTSPLNTSAFELPGKSIFSTVISEQPVHALKDRAGNKVRLDRWKCRNQR